MYELLMDKNLIRGIVALSIFLLGFTPCKAEQPLRGMELQVNEAQKDQSTQEICLERIYS